MREKPYKMTPELAEALSRGAKIEHRKRTDLPDEEEFAKITAKFMIDSIPVLKLQEEKERLVDEIEKLKAEIRWLRSEPKKGDYIIREDAVRLIHEKADGYRPSHFASSHEHIKVREMTLDCAVKIENLPSVDAEPVRHGWWIPKTHIDGEVTHECSYCGEEAIYYDNHQGGITSEPTDYCPYCGTKMDLGDIG